MVVGHLQTHVVNAWRRISEGRFCGAAVVELAVAVQVPGVRERVTDIRIGGCGSVECNRHRRRARQRRCRRAGLWWTIAVEVGFAADRSADVDDKEIAAGTDFELHREN